jgi:uncharacterized membrane protein YoaK (UPF0700 family)
MAGLSLWIGVVVAFVAMCAITPMIASKKNRPPALWFVLGLLFNPIALVILLRLPSPSPASWQANTGS